MTGVHSAVSRSVLVHFWAMHLLRQKMEIESFQRYNNDDVIQYSGEEGGRAQHLFHLWERSNDMRDSQKEMKKKKSA